MLNVIDYYLDFQISKDQAGFVKVRDKPEQITNGRQMIEKQR